MYSPFPVIYAKMTKDKEREVFEMSTEEKRLSTFKKWPYGSDTSINKEKVSIFQKVSFPIYGIRAVEISLPHYSNICL